MRRLRSNSLHEGVFQRIALTVVGSEEMYKIQSISVIECPMLESYKWFQITFCRMKHKLVWIIVHEVEQLPALFDNRHPLTPGKNCSEKPSDLNVLFFSKLMWYANWIIFDKSGLIIQCSLFVKKNLQLMLVQTIPGYRRSLQETSHQWLQAFHKRYQTA